MERTEHASVSRASTPGARTASRVAARAPSSLRRATSADRLLELQRTHGNAVVARAIQCKLAVSQPGDVFEQEADRVAEAVMSAEPGSQGTGTVDRREEPGAEIHRMCRDCQDEIGRQPTPLDEEDEDMPAVQRQEAEEDEDTVQTKSAGTGSFDVETDTENGIRSLGGGGSALPAPVRTDMESRMGFDFTGVRVHTDANAGHLARSVNALAFTFGNNLVFGSGQYQPETPSGKKLLAHELTHVVQQTGGVPRQADRDE